MNRRPIVWGWRLFDGSECTKGIALNVEGAMVRIVDLQHEASWDRHVMKIASVNEKKPAVVISNGKGDAAIEQLNANSCLDRWSEHRFPFSGLIWTRDVADHLTQVLTKKKERRDLQTSHAIAALVAARYCWVFNFSLFQPPQ